MRNLYALLVVSFSLALLGCEKYTCDEVVPEIEVVNFEVVGDSGVVTINFKDCDGDIGLGENETTGDFQYNLYMEYEEYTNGSYDTIGSLALPYYYRIPRVETGANSPVKEGQFFVTLFPYYLTGYSDTFRFRVQLFDRALNGSNFSYTEMLITPQQEEGP